MLSEGSSYGIGTIVCQQGHLFLVSCIFWVVRSFNKLLNINKQLSHDSILTPTAPSLEMVGVCFCHAQKTHTQNTHTQKHTCTKDPYLGNDFQSKLD